MNASNPSISITAFTLLEIFLLQPSPSYEAIPFVAPIIAANSPPAECPATTILFGSILYFAAFFLTQRMEDFTSYTPAGYKASVESRYSGVKQTYPMSASRCANG